MKKVLIINGGQVYDESGGKFNNTLTDWTSGFLTENGFEVRITKTGEEYDTAKEIENFVWADIIIFHTPIWWFQVPNRLKLFIDDVFQQGRGTIYKSDGRTHSNPEYNYGTGGLLQGRKYMVTSSWNAPEGAFTIPGEIMYGFSPDKGVLYGFHIAMKFVGLTQLDGMHFYDVAKGGTPERIEAYRQAYQQHLEQII
ncbi:NAD(P)H-dependent oxidoreductase [Pedobacter sp. BS3]|uniref:NAD(P)H-dependent oxidoreductase n=1 Tax=Pedobacter sp. BS3 TaxID=2567937 RepID=UPI0011ED1EC8|nr:NAD(P)H-dependent oxidoreductase [Pedobacter sp. BS3]TZF83554.1 NAD(P)H-dependent oxidoreductase [Pedobacter sp. BS3]